MPLSLHPRGDFWFPHLRPSRPYVPVDSGRDNRRSLPPDYRAFGNHNVKRAPRQPCFDWIFSTASNVHVAIDRSSFKTYTTFTSFVLALSDHRRVPVRGIGTVEIQVQRSATSNDFHVIVLEDVLHIPSWICNIFSDVYFLRRRMKHTWSPSGVRFKVKGEDGVYHSWGFTADFCGQEKLAVLGSQYSRSPMKEDKEREIFCVNVKWPQLQRDNWEAFGVAELI